MPYSSAIGQALQQPALRQPAWNPPQQRGQMLAGPPPPDAQNAANNARAQAGAQQAQGNPYAAQAQAQANSGGLMGTSRAPLNPDWQPKRQPTPMGTGNQQIPAAPAPPPYVAPPAHNPLDRGQSMYGPKPVNQGFGYDRSFGPGQTAPTKSFGG